MLSITFKFGTSETSSPPCVKVLKVPISAIQYGFAVRRLTEDPFYKMMNQSAPARRWMVRETPWTPRRFPDTNTILEHYQGSPEVTLFHFRNRNAPKIIKDTWIRTQSVNLSIPYLNRKPKVESLITEIPWGHMWRLKSDPFYIMMNTCRTNRRWMVCNVPWQPKDARVVKGRTILKFFEDMGPDIAMRFFRRHRAPAELKRIWKRMYYYIPPEAGRTPCDSADIPLECANIPKETAALIRDCPGCEQASREMFYEPPKPGQTCLPRGLGPET